MQIKVKNVRFSFLSVKNPYIATDKDGTKKETWRAAGICEPDTTFEATGKDGTKKILPYTSFGAVLDKICKDKWQKTVKEMGPKFQVFVFNRADTQVGSRGPRVDDSGSYYDGYTPETWFFSASTELSKRPDGIVIVGPRASEGPLPKTSAHPVSGDYGHLLINIFAFDGANGKGISASIEGIQYTKKGVPFGNAPADASSFDDEELVDDDEINADGEEDPLF